MARIGGQLAKAQWLEGVNLDVYFEFKIYFLARILFTPRGLKPPTALLLIMALNRTNMITTRKNAIQVQIQ